MTLVRSSLGYYVDPDTGLVLRPVGSRDSNGYVRIDRRYAGEPAVAAHRVVWEAVHGPIPPGMVINHRNGVKDDNRIENLEVVTPQGNALHAFAAGLRSNRGERHPGARLTDDAVRDIRRLASAGQTHDALSEQFGVSRRQVNDVVRGRSWSHVPVEA